MAATDPDAGPCKASVAGRMARTVVAHVGRRRACNNIRGLGKWLRCRVYLELELFLQMILRGQV